MYHNGGKIVAEFQEIMQQFNRMCKASAGCLGCPLHEQDGVDRCSVGAFINDSEHIEREVMAWAAEHPEPVYPTWGEWLCNIGLIHDCTDVVEMVHRLFHNSIPADIAQKLGIEPKEG